MDRIYVMQLVRSFQVGQISRRTFCGGRARLSAVWRRRTCCWRRVCR